MQKLVTVALSTVLAGGMVLVAAPDSHAATSLRLKALSTAAAQKGKPYKSGAVGPSAYDCSGLTLYSYKKNGKTLRRTAQAQYNQSTKISASKRTKGDLVFFGATNSIYHVGIYAGGGYIWHSPKPGKRVEKVKLWTSSVHYGRING
jgi:cell wall-associated NlpC family hydrolase